MNKFLYKYVYVCDCLKVMKIGLIIQNDYRDGELQQTRYWRIFLCHHFSYSLFPACSFSKLYLLFHGTHLEKVSIGHFKLVLSKPGIHSNDCFIDLL